MHQTLLLDTLNVLFVLSAESLEPTIARLTHHIGVHEADVVDALFHLESRGLVTAHNRRLTMRGLAAAAALHAHQADATIARAA